MTAGPTTTPSTYSTTVVIERVPIRNRWATDMLRVAGVEIEDGPGLPPGVAGSQRWRFEGQAIELHRSEAEGYFLNITSDEPKVFVMWRRTEEGEIPPAQPVIVTVSYNEAGRFMDGGEQVDAVSMPASILAWIRPFVDEHYRPEPRRKHRRNVHYGGDAPPEDQDPSQ